MTWFENVDTCRDCGCTDAHPCLGPGLRTCGWARTGLCSFCDARRRRYRELGMEFLTFCAGVAPRRALFSGNLETWFSTAPVGPGHGLTWSRCGAALNREIATRICRVRLASWADTELEREDD